VGSDVSRSAGRWLSQAGDGSASLSASQLLWDGGRQQALVDWRTQLADAAGLALRSQQEQVALGAVSLALERSRYRAQEQVYGQYARKMACLVDALSQVVAADRGRASELLQARKALQQAELARERDRVAAPAGRDPPAAAGGRAGLRRPRAGRRAAALAGPGRVLAATEQAPEVAQLQRQAQAASHFERSVAASGKPQISWTVSGSRAAGSAARWARSTAAPCRRAWY
jgi:adhesin transport system outer membrane protein